MLRSHCSCILIENSHGEHKIIYAKITPEKETWIILDVKENLKSSTVSSALIITFPGDGQTEGCLVGTWSCSGKSINPFLNICIQSIPIAVMATSRCAVALSARRVNEDLVSLFLQRATGVTYSQGQERTVDSGLVAFTSQLVWRRCVTRSSFLLCFPGHPHQVAYIIL